MAVIAPKAVTTALGGDGNGEHVPHHGGALRPVALHEPVPHERRTQPVGERRVLDLDRPAQRRQQVGVLGL
jgi:hypothetical protein